MSSTGDATGPDPTARRNGGWDTGQPRRFGLRLPTADAESLTPRMALRLLERFAGRPPDPRTANLPCLLLLDGVEIRAGDPADPEPPTPAEETAYYLALLCAVVGGEEVTVSLRPARDFEGVLAWLERVGGEVTRSDEWRLAWARDVSRAHPFDVAFVHLFHQSVPPPTRRSDREESVPLPGAGTLRDQFLALPLFSMETSHLMHYRVSVIGPGRWETVVPAWEVDLIGYDVEEQRTWGWREGRGGERWPEGIPHAYVLRRADGPGRFTPEVTVEARKPSA
jgi:hypothetical protein